jgi:hypothetical protein
MKIDLRGKKFFSYKGTLECLRDWDPAREDRQKAARRLKTKGTFLDVSGGSVNEEASAAPVVVADNCAGKNKMKTARSSAHFLKERDLKECLEKTSFTEDQVLKELKT